MAGVDEVGRGCLFGPVFAGAVILDPARPIRGLNDSKALDAGQREVLDVKIRERAMAWAVGAADCFEIDDINILQAAKLAMKLRRSREVDHVCSARVATAMNKNQNSDKPLSTDHHPRR